MEIKFKLKENIIKLIVHTGYFLSLFIIGLILTYIVTRAALQFMPGGDLNAIITWGGIIVFAALSLIDIGLVFNKKVSPAIILLGLPVAAVIVIWRAIKYALKYALPEKISFKFVFETTKDIFKLENDNALNSIANNLCKKHY
jgi:multisubunit Na+/H+ antiporter MnhE subunit